MANLDQLVQDSLAGMINQGGLPTADALYGQQAQSQAENLFGRGLGISSVSRDALAKAKVDATLASQNAQLAALGQAAGVAQNELNRGQQASQFGQSLALQKKGLGQQADIANKNLIAQGLGLGVGGLAGIAGKTFGPTIAGGLKQLARLGPQNETMLPMDQRPGQVISSPGSIDTGAPGGNIGAPMGGQGLGDVGLPDLTGFGSGAGSGGGGLDLSWLSDPSTSFNLDALSGLGSSLPDFSQLWAP